MKTLALRVRRFLASEDGPTAVEYAVMLALILVACIATVKALGTKVNSTFQEVNTGLGGT
jgi:pilus assembly protein Flp/PilA